MFLTAVKEMSVRSRVSLFSQPLFSQPLFSQPVLAPWQVHFISCRERRQKTKHFDEITTSTVKLPLLICIQDSGLRRFLSFFKMQCGDDDDDDDDDGTCRDGQIADLLEALKSALLIHLIVIA